MDSLGYAGLEGAPCWSWQNAWGLLGAGVMIEAVDCDMQRHARPIK